MTSSDPIALSDLAGNWFVGLPATVDSAALEGCFDGAPASLRRYHPHDLHFTLAFFGRLDDERVAAVLDRLDSIDEPALEVVFDTLVLLPSPRRPRVVALDTRAPEPAAMITRHRGALLAAAGCPPDLRPPRPHLTIARPPRRLTAADRRALEAWSRLPHHAPVPVRLAAPRLFGWSRARPARQFVVVERCR